MKLVLGSRGSALALWQANHIASRLGAVHAGLVVEVKIIKTEGDQRPDVPLSSAGGKGVFVREIESALAEGTIDLAVHSLKDLPTDTTAGLVIAAIPEREDPRDALVSHKASEVAMLPWGAILATGSPRRKSQLLHARRDLRFTEVRGNVDTRVRKLDGGDFDALVLAAAGLNRLGITGAPWSAIPASVCLPAPGQGALAIETREADSATRGLVEALEDPATRVAVAAERAFLAALGAGCLAPAGALASVADGVVALDAMVGMPDGSALRRAGLRGPAGDAEGLGARLAARIMDDGGEAIVRASREEDPAP